MKQKLIKVSTSFVLCCSMNCSAQDLSTNSIAQTIQKALQTDTSSEQKLHSTDSLQETLQQNSSIINSVNPSNDNQNPNSNPNNSNNILITSPGGLGEVIPQIEPVNIDEAAIKETQENFNEEVKTVNLSDEDMDSYIQIIDQQIKDKHPELISQYIFVVDSNFKKQLGFLAFWHAKEQKVEVLGVVHVSTGSTREGHFITPIGFFKNTTENPSYRALGTVNSQGIRGLGSKGMRVYDFGWQTTNEGWDRGRSHEIRFLMHATDPTYLEQRLGRPDSKGCIRIPSELNVFLDHYGILDAVYEQQATKSWVLAKDREPVKYAGSWLLVMNTEEPDIAKN